MLAPSAMVGQKLTYKLTCNAKKLDRKDGPFGKSGRRLESCFFAGSHFADATEIDPYVEIKYGSKLLGKSAVVDKNLNPFWKPFFIDLSECNGTQHSSR